MQDITPVDDIRLNPKCDREIAVYGYLRGTKLKGNARVHIAGVGDATVSVTTHFLAAISCVPPQICCACCHMRPVTGTAQRMGHMLARLHRAAWYITRLVVKVTQKM